MTTPEYLQDLFDRAVGGIIKQGKPSVEAGSCVYRSPGGCKCVVGQVIPDERYSRTLEGRRARSPEVMNAVLAEDDSAWETRSRIADLLADLQTAHDNGAASAYRDLDGWRRRFKEKATEVAALFNLDAAVGAREWGQ